MWKWAQRKQHVEMVRVICALRFAVGGENICASNEKRNGKHFILKREKKIKDVISIQCHCAHMKGTNEKFMEYFYWTKWIVNVYCTLAMRCNTEVHTHGFKYWIFYGMFRFNRVFTHAYTQYVRFPVVFPFKFSTFYSKFPLYRQIPCCHPFDARRWIE